MKASAKTQPHRPGHAPGYSGCPDKRTKARLVDPDADPEKVAFFVLSTLEGSFSIAKILPEPPVFFDDL